MELEQLGEKKYKDLEPANVAMVANAQELKVIDDGSYSIAASIGREATARIKLIQNEFRESKEAAHKAHKSITAFEKKLIDPLKLIKSTCSQKMGAYDYEKEQKARKEAAIIAAEARKAQEEAALRQAAELEKAGDKEGAEMVLDEGIDPTFNPPPPPIERAPKTEGVKVRTIWKHRIIDASKVPDDFKIIDEKRLAQYARAMKSQAKVSGVQFYEERGTAFG